MEGILSLGLGSDLTIQQVVQEQQQIILEVQSLALHSCCPLCLSPSERAHSQYQRTVVDLPSGGLQVTLRLTVRRFFCDNARCIRQIFTERLPQLLVPHAQITNRLREALRTLSFATSAQAASRLAPHLGMKRSPSSLLRLQKTTIVAEPETCTKIGLDDFAFRRGKTYGTIIVDLDTHHVIDLLPDRSVSTVVAWLQAHPNLEVVSRDRGADYMTAITQGAPQAIQVSDRWHLLHNLRHYLSLFLTRMYPRLQKASREFVPRSRNEYPLPEPDSPVTKESIWVAPKKEYRRKKTVREKNKEATSAKRLDMYQQALALREQGLRSEEIAPLIGLSARTVRRWLAEGTEKGLRQKRSSPLDVFASYMYQRIRTGGPTGKLLYEELHSLGYKGSLTSFYHYLDRWRSPDSAPEPPDEPEINSLPQHSLSPNPLDTCDAKQIVWMYLRDPDELTVQEVEQLLFIQHVHPTLKRVYELVQEFVAMVRNRQGECLEAWLERMRMSRVSEMVRFGSGIEQDKIAVQAALTLHYSNGMVEGHVHRLKLIKRQGYGRASFLLLRLRVLFSF